MFINGLAVPVVGRFFVCFVDGVEYGGDGGVGYFFLVMAGLGLELRLECRRLWLRSDVRRGVERQVGSSGIVFPDTGRWLSGVVDRLTARQLRLLNRRYMDFGEEMVVSMEFMGDDMWYGVEGGWVYSVWGRRPGEVVFRRISVCDSGEDAFVVAVEWFTQAGWFG